ncbi:MAG: futalosine hydrolase [Phycisphaerae bacterium]|nr:futalosine hydrolase [Phycisphaerae bacterium]
MVAAPLEARAVLAGFRCASREPETWTACPVGDGFKLLVCGVGKSNAAGATAREIGRSRPDCVINLGICGALPGPEPLRIGQSILASGCVFADEGIDASPRWIPMSQAGFPAGIDADRIEPEAELSRRLRPLADRVGVLATVSTCSGSDARSGEISSRCGSEGLAEAMEGAAIGLVAARERVPFAELRVASNRTGNRADQGWDLPLALRGLEAIASRLAGALRS